MNNLTWMLFGGWRYRLRGFLIGLVVGLFLGVVFSGQIANLIPKAFADVVMDQDVTGDLSSYVSSPGFYNPRYAFYLLQGVEVGTDGLLESVKLYLRKGGGTTSASMYSIDIYSYNVETEMPDEFLGSSGNFNWYSTLTTDYQLKEFNIEPLENEAQLYFEDGEKYVIVLNFSDCDENCVSNNRVIQWGLIMEDYVGNAFLCEDSAFTDCSGAFESGVKALQFQSYVENEWEGLEPPALAYGPHIALVDSFNLGYDCNDDGAIWAANLSAVDPSFYDTGEVCDGQNSGVLELEGLETGINEWEFKLRVGDYWSDAVEALVYYDMDALPTAEPGDYGAYEGESCLSMVFYQGEDPLEEIDWSACVLSAFTSDECLEGGKRVVLSGFSRIGQAFADIPVIGDYLELNCVFKEGLIDNFEPDESFEVTAGLDILGETKNFDVDVKGVKDALSEALDENIGYDNFRSLMTVFLWFGVLYVIWLEFFSHRGHGDQ